MAIWLRFKGYIIGFVGLVAGVLAIYFAGNRNGVQNEFNRQAKADAKQARTIEDAADLVRKHDGDNVDAIERLRKHKRLRDL
jgi:hypothetical protein